MMTDFREAAAAIFLGANAISDIKSKRICLISVPMAAAAGIACSISDGWNTFYVLPGIVPGAVLILISIFSNGEIGMGDGIVAAAAGFLLGPAETFGMCGAGSIFAAAAAGILWVWKRNGKAELPFVPFLFAGLAAVILAGKC